MSYDRHNQNVERLEQELALLQTARKPEEVAKDIRDWVDKYAGDDYLTRTCEYMNPWVPDKEQKGKKKRKE
jgi:hypothetical protein